MSSIQTAYDLVVQACNDPHIGYSMSKRTTIKLGQSYDTYCDCSSLMAWALTGAGFYTNNPWFRTKDNSERESLISAGFKRYNPSTTAWQAGDILWRYGHTEMVYEGRGTKGITMGAHTDSYAFARQVSINTFESAGSSWEELYRADGEVVEERHWTQGNRYLTNEEMYSNAIIIYHYFTAKGWTDQAVAGLLGNMQQESTINPALWQNLTVGTGGYGLAQWTPASKYRNWAASEGISFDDADQNGFGQLRFIDETHSQEYYPTSAYPQTWEQFQVMANVEEATKCFLYNYERAGDAQLQNRLDYANYWYHEIITNFPRDIGNPPPATYPWLYGMLHYRRWNKRL